MHLPEVPMNRQPLAARASPPPRCYHYYLLLRSTCRAIKPGAPHPTEWRRLEELFRLDSIVSILIELVHPRTLNVVERVINDVLRELVKALRDYCKPGSTDFIFAHHERASSESMESLAAENGAHSTRGVP
ncbi:hypothetical protein GGG16DRAFT_120056 [Schizophyllum commune]